MPDKTHDLSSADIRLREVLPEDLTVFFEQQLDPQAIYMAAFTAKNPSDRYAFDAHWAKILRDASITLRAVLFQGRVAGNVVCHAWFGEPEVGYWIGRQFWGKGIATRALALFLEIETRRPLYARAAKDNLRSIRVLEKNGFTRSGEGRGYANARGMEIEENIYKLD